VTASHPDKPSQDLLARVVELHQKAAQAAADGDLDHVDALIAEATQLRRQAARPPRSAPRARTGTERTSTRAQAVTALDDMGIPSPPREISSFHLIRFGVELDVRGLASVRRDERKAFDRYGTARPSPYLVPALDVRYLQPVRGPLALSSWPLERRLLATTSPRVDHVRLTRRLAELAARLDGEPAVRMLDLVGRYAQTIPGALDGNTIDPGRVRDAADDELQQIAGPDDYERSQAADRARQQLDDAALLWGWDGRPGLQVLDGGHGL
jgi:hypothetical protein